MPRSVLGAADNHFGPVRFGRYFDASAGYVGVEEVIVRQVNWQRHIQLQLAVCDICD